MKRHLILTAAAALAMVSPAFAQMPGKIVTVDLTRVFNEYYKKPSIESKLKETGESFQKEFQVMTAEYNKQREDLNKLREEQDRPEYTPEVREQKRRAVSDKLTELQKREREILEYQRSHQQILDQQSSRMRQALIKEISESIGKEARDAGYALVLDKSGNTFNGVPAVIYGQDVLDITDSIVKILNKDAPKK